METESTLIGAAVPVHATKYDGAYHRRWPMRYVMRRGPLYVLEFELGTLATKTRDPADDPDPAAFTWPGELYLWEDRWYNTCRVLREGRTWYYTNIATPAEFDGSSFHYIDLDLDVSWYPHNEPRVHDDDEFLDHSASMGYPPEVIERARAAVDEVLGHIAARAFPFDRP